MELPLTEMGKTGVQMGKNWLRRSLRSSVWDTLRLSSGEEENGVGKSP